MKRDEKAGKAGCGEKAMLWGEKRDEKAGKAGCGEKAMLWGENRDEKAGKDSKCRKRKTF